MTSVVIIHPQRQHPSGMGRCAHWVCQACGEPATYLTATKLGEPFICGLCRQEKGR